MLDWRWNFFRKCSLSQGRNRYAELSLQEQDFSLSKDWKAGSRAENRRGSSIRRFRNQSKVDRTRLAFCYSLPRGRTGRDLRPDPGRQLQSRYWNIGITSTLFPSMESTSSQATSEQSLRSTRNKISGNLLRRRQNLDKSMREREAAAAATQEEGESNPGPHSRKKKEKRSSASLDLLFSPRSIAILGASPSPGKLGRSVLENLSAQGYTGEIYPINPNFSEVLGRKCFAKISEVPNAADLAVILIPARDVEQAVLECIENGTMHFVIMSSGFKETGDEVGEQREERLSNIALRTGARIVGPNCLGVYDNISRVDTFFLPRTLVQRPEKGVLSLASQSGSFVGHLSRTGFNRKLGHRKGDNLRKQSRC